MAEDSYVDVNDAGRAVAFVGPDATNLFAATVLRGGIDFYLTTGMKVNTAYTPTAMLRAASGYTGKAYKRGQLAQASADLTQWIVAMQAALPIKHV